MESIYIVAIMALMAAGIALLSLSARKQKKYVRFKVQPVKRAKKFIGLLNGEERERIGEPFLAAGINLKMSSYNSIRNAFFLCILAFLIIKLCQGGVYEVRIPACASMAAFYISMPAMSYGKKQKPTPFNKIIEIATDKYNQAKDEELMNLTMLLKNIVFTQKDSPKTADYIIEALLGYSKMNKNALQNTLSYLRRGKGNIGYSYLAKELNTSMGKDFSMILCKIDELMPAELLPQLDALQNIIREEKRTRQLQKQEAAGHKIFMLASIFITFIMFNYMYILFNYLMVKMEV